MDAVMKVEDDDMQAATAGAALDEWPPPTTSTHSDVVHRKDSNNSSRLLFLVEYVGEPENAPFTNGNEQFICDIDSQVVNPLDPSMNCVACYSPVQYALPNRTNNNSRPNSPFQSGIVSSSSSNIIADKSPNISSATADSTIQTKYARSSDAKSNSENKITMNTSNADGGFAVTTSSQSLASPLSAPPGTPSSPLSTLTRSPVHNDDDTSILIIENQFTLSAMDNVPDNFIMNTPTDFQNACSSEIAQPVTAADNNVRNGTVESSTSNNFILPDSLVLDSADKLLMSTSNMEHSTELAINESVSVKDQAVGERQQLEVLLENGISLGFVDQDSRVIQIPREYIMAAKIPPLDDPSNEDAYLRNLFNSFKAQGLLVDSNEENGEIRLVSFLDADQENGMDNLINQALVVDDAQSSNPSLLPSLPLATHPVQQKEITLKDYSNQDWMSSYERCQECSSTVDGDCAMHRVNGIISDKPVPSRARATLPASYLAINWLSTSVESSAPVYGVFARKTIPNRTQFGPVEGILMKNEDPDVIVNSPLESPLELLLESESGEMRRLDVSNENMSNWMRFVRPAKTIKEQNLILSQQGHSLYFTSIRQIHPRQELLVWYSPTYAAKRNLRLLEPERNLKDQCETVWPCFECEEKFKSSEELQKHLNTHDVDRDDKNEGMKTRSKKQGTNQAVRRKTQSYVPPVKKYRLSDNKSNQEKNQTFECTICKRSFPRMYSLKRHLQLHNAYTDKKYQCPHCSFVFTHPYNRDRHVRKRHSHKITTTNTKVVPCGTEETIGEDKGWLCKHCNLTFPSASVLNLHTLAHAAENLEESEVLTGLPSDFSNVYHEGEFLVENGDIQCPQCTQEFHTKRDLIEHVSAHGQKTSSTELVTSNKGMVVANSVGQQNTSSDKRRCEYCYKIFSSVERLQKHVLIHSNDEVRPYQCNFCQKRFLSSPALSCHQKIHTLSKSFECPICKQKFDQLLALKAHVHCHAKNGLFTCPHCQKEFEEYSLIRKHIRAFHCDRKFICAYCEKLFHTQDKLRMHMLSHSDHREFLCADCGKQFKRKDKLKEHMKRMHSTEREQKTPPKPARPSSAKKCVPRVASTSDYERFIFKCHPCLLGFKRRGMLVNHLANRHPDITPESVPELNLPILKTTRDYYCQYCEKIYKSSSKRKAHILKYHPGAELPMSNRQKGGVPDIPGLPNPTYSQTVGSITTTPHGCQWCHKQYASKAKLLQHQRKKHLSLLPSSQQQPRPGKNGSPSFENDVQPSTVSSSKDTVPAVVNMTPASPSAPVGNVPLTPPVPQSAATEDMKPIGSSAVATTYTVASLAPDISNISTAADVTVDRPVNSIATVPTVNVPSITTTVSSASVATKAGATAFTYTGSVLPQSQLFTIHPLSNQGVIADSYLSEYEIATGDTDFAEGGIIIDTATLKRELKNGGNESLQGEAALLMSELGCSLSDIRSLTSHDQQYLKLIQMPAGIVISDALNDPFYTPYPAR